MTETARKSPEDQVRDLQKSVAGGDLAGMMTSIGDIHTQWAAFSPEQQTEIKKMEAVFLSMLQAKAVAKA